MSVFHEAQASWLLAKQGVVKRSKLGRNPAAWALLMLTGLVLLVGITPQTSWRSVVAAGAGPMFVLALLWWGYIYAAIVEQNRYSAGKLVPGLRRRSLQVVFGLFVVLALVFATLFSLYFGTSMVPLATVMMLLSMVAMTTLNPILILPVVAVLILGGLSPGLLHKVLSSVQRDRDIWKWTVLLLAAPLTLLWIYLEIKNLGRGQPVRRNVNQWPSWGWPGQRTATLNGNGTIGELLLHAVGLRWSILMTVTSIHLVMWTVAMTMQVPVNLLQYVSAFIQIMLAIMLRSLLSMRPREQALVRLTPRAPASAVFNAVLARTLLQRYLRGWAVCSLMGLAAGYMISRDTASVARMAMIALLTLPAAVMFLGDHTRLPGVLEKLAFVVWLAVLFLLPGWAAEAPRALQQVTAVLLLGAACGVIWLAMRRMARAPIVFPVGRLA